MIKRLDWVAKGGQKNNFVFFGEYCIFCIVFCIIYFVLLSLFILYFVLENITCSKGGQTHFVEFFWALKDRFSLIVWNYFPGGMFAWNLKSLENQPPLPKRHNIRLAEKQKILSLLFQGQQTFPAEFTTPLPQPPPSFVCSFELNRMKIRRISQYQ